MSITAYDISIMDDILSGKHNWFTAKLLRLMADADLDNLKRLASVYPEEFVEFAKWKWHGIPLMFSTVDGVRNLVTYQQKNTDLGLAHINYPRWLNPETGESVNVSIVHGRDI